MTDQHDTPHDPDAMPDMTCRVCSEPVNRWQVGDVVSWAHPRRAEYDRRQFDPRADRLAVTGLRDRPR